MECPICFNIYNCQQYRPLKTFCQCQQTLCLTCINDITRTSKFCPWDKALWSGRKLMEKFEFSTPKNYLKALEEKEKRIQEESKLIDQKKLKQLDLGDLELAKIIEAEELGRLDQEDRKRMEERLAIEKRDEEYVKELLKQESKDEAMFKEHFPTTSIKPKAKVNTSNEKIVFTRHLDYEKNKYIRNLFKQDSKIPKSTNGISFISDTDRGDSDVDIKPVVILDDIKPTNISATKRSKSVASYFKPSNEKSSVIDLISKSIQNTSDKALKVKSPKLMKGTWSCPVCLCINAIDLKYCSKCTLGNPNLTHYSPSSSRSSSPYHSKIRKSDIIKSLKPRQSVSSVTMLDLSQDSPQQNRSISTSTQPHPLANSPSTSSHPKKRQLLYYDPNEPSDDEQYTEDLIHNSPPKQTTSSSSISSSSFHLNSKQIKSPRYSNYKPSPTTTNNSILTTTSSNSSLITNLITTSSTIPTSSSSMNPIDKPTVKNSQSPASMIVLI